MPDARFCLGHGISLLNNIGSTNYRNVGLSITKRTGKLPKRVIPYPFATSDSCSFVGFITKNKYLNTEQDLIYNAITKICPSAISLIIMKYAYIDTRCILGLRTLKLSENLYLHYINTTDKTFPVVAGIFGGLPSLTFDNDITSMYILDIFLKDDRMENHYYGRLRNYRKYYVNYNNTVIKKNKVTLFPKSKTQNIPVIQYIDKKQKYEFGMTNEDILLQFSMNAIDCIKSIKIHSLISATEYDSIYMKHIDKLICQSHAMTNIHLSKNTFSISFTNGYFGYFNLQCIDDLHIIVNYNDSQITKIETDFYFTTCSSVS